MEMTTMDAPTQYSLTTMEACMTEQEEALLPTGRFWRNIYFFVLALILPIGFILNILAIVVLATSKKLRKTSMGHFLIALAVSDLIFIIAEFIKWLNTPYDTGCGPPSHVLGVSFMDTSTAWCRLVYSTRYSAQLSSSYITIGITIERLICIAVPLKAAKLSTPRKARWTIFSIFLLTFALGWSACFVLASNGTNCIVIDLVKYDMWFWAVIRILSFILPWLVLAVLTAIIIYFLYKMKKTRLQITDQQNACVMSGIELQLTAMLLAVVITFFVLRTPYTVSYNIWYSRNKIWIPLEAKTEVKLIIVNDMCELLNILNYAINFFLYFLAGSSFRASFKNLISHLIKCKNDESEVATTVTTASTRNMHAIKSQPEEKFELRT